MLIGSFLGMFFALVAMRFRLYQAVSGTFMIARFAMPVRVLMMHRCFPEAPGSFQV
jgi:ABC-type uncharacterized transport system permease subunit